MNYRASEQLAKMQDERKQLSRQLKEKEIKLSGKMNEKLLKY